MLDLNDIRREFAAFLIKDHTRFRMDAALYHVAQLAYEKGIADERLKYAPTAAGIAETRAGVVDPREQLRQEILANDDWHAAHDFETGDH